MSNDRLSAIFYNHIKLMEAYHRKIHHPVDHPGPKPVQVNAATEGLYGNVASASLPDFYAATNAPMIDNFS
jgi:hypothetical protein